MGNDTITAALRQAGQGSWSTASVVLDDTVVAHFNESTHADASAPPLSDADIAGLPQLFTSHEAALAAGVVLPSRDNLTFSVHRYHKDVKQGLDVVYGRTGDASSGQGVVVARLAGVSGTEADKPASPQNGYAYIVATYRFPYVSSLAVPTAIKFANETLRHAVSS